MPPAEASRDRSEQQPPAVEPSSGSRSSSGGNGDFAARAAPPTTKESLATEILQHQKRLALVRQAIPVADQLRRDFGELHTMLGQVSAPGDCTPMNRAHLAG